MPLLLGMGAAMALIFLPFFGALLPLVTSWTVSLHEVCHGLAALMTGGSVVSLDVQWKHGMAISQGGWYPIISMAGYVGTAIVGALFFLASVHALARWLALFFLALASFLLFGYAHWSAAFFFALFANTIAGICLFLDKRGASASFFATMLMYPQWSDVQQLLWYQTGNTDAGLLAAHFGLPWLAWPIALVYTLGTVLVWFWALRYVMRHSYTRMGSRNVPPPP